VRGAAGNGGPYRDNQKPENFPREDSFQLPDSYFLAASPRNFKM
jgi:hypothetical protein